VTLRRFDLVTRWAHWATAVLTLGLLTTGTILYVGQLEAAVGRRALLASIHVWCGVLLLVPLVVSVSLREAGRGLRSDLHELSWWTRSDRRWLRRSKRTQPDGKFNGGQKLATALFGGLLVAQIVTGALMHWNEPFSDDWRTGATFVHDWGYVALFFLIVGHVGRALQEPELLKSMIVGDVPVDWARRERPAWAAARSDARPKTELEA
jgi:formate dehydrogenase subunit gamma